MPSGELPGPSSRVPGPMEEHGDAPHEPLPHADWGAVVRGGLAGARMIGEYDGVEISSLHPGSSSPLLVFSELSSTQDAAHLLGREGAPSGTVVVADRQLAGRGRQGRRWESARSSGVWLTRLERPRDRESLGVLSLRLGLLLAEALEPFTGCRPRVKWPNDVHVRAGKLAGILVEARWRDDRPEWVSIGVGVNVREPDESTVAGTVREGVTRVEVLRAVLRVLGESVCGGGVLSADELAAWASRDLAVGRQCRAPVAGTVLGITADGALRIRDESGVERAARAGSLELVPGPSVGDDACCS